MGERTLNMRADPIIQAASPNVDACESANLLSLASNSSDASPLKADGDADISSHAPTLGSRKRGTRAVHRPRKKKASFCKEPGCTSYAREQGFCIKHGGGKLCGRAGCTTKCYALGFCFKHGNETYNTTEYESAQQTKKVKCTGCEKIFDAPICLITACNQLIKNKENPENKAFCQIHGRQLLLALKECETKAKLDQVFNHVHIEANHSQKGANSKSELKTMNTNLNKTLVNSGEGLIETPIRDLLTPESLPRFADTKNAAKASCYSNKKKVCSVEGCFSLARKGGNCQKHVIKDQCEYDGCTSPAQARGLCGHHGGGKRCKFTKCYKVATLGEVYCALHLDLNQTESRPVADKNAKHVVTSQEKDDSYIMNERELNDIGLPADSALDMPEVPEMGI